MRSQYIKPENALQRAEELLEVNAPSEALVVLQETLLSRRSRGAPITSLEPVAIKFIELVVDLNRSRVAREGLHLFKNLAQNSSVASVEKVIRKFIERSDLKLKEAKVTQDAKTASVLAAAAALDDGTVDDLETVDTFESMYATMINTLDDPDAGATAMAVAAVGSNVATKASRRDRESVTSRLKFLWDAYRTVLDVLRNNARLELLYQQTVAQAFSFCLSNNRKNEFRRLCETLRTHLASLPRQSVQHNGINLSDPEILQRFIDTRFLQLQTANDMELWQESFRSAEDIYQLLVMAGSLIAPNAAQTPGAMVGFLPAALFTHKRHGAKMTQIVAQYYQKLTRIFTVSEDRLFLAAAWNKYHSWVSNLRGTAGLSEQDQSVVASHVVLSALAAPVFSEPVDPDAHNRFNRANRLAQMLGMSKVPDRALLLGVAGAKSVLNKVPDHVRAVYNAMETDFHPLIVAAAVRPHLNAIEADPQMAKYVPHLRTVIVASVLKAISNLYTTMSLATALDLTSVSDEPLCLFTLEKVVLQGNHKREFNIKINYLTQTLEFTSEAVVPNLDALLDFPLYEEHIAKEKDMIFERAREMAEEEHKELLDRQVKIEEKKIAAEKAAQRKQEEEAKERARKAIEEREALQRKMAEEAQQREVERLKREQEEMKKAEARKIAEALKAKSGLKIADEHLDELDTAAIFALQAEQIKREREQLENKMKAIVKRADYFERALRMEELPLLHKFAQEQKVADRTAFEETRKRTVEEAKERHANAVAIKHRVLRMLTDYHDYRTSMESGLVVKMDERAAQCLADLESSKRERRENVKSALKAKIAEKIQREGEMEKRRAAEEAERTANRSTASSTGKVGWTPTRTSSGTTPAWKSRRGQMGGDALGQTPIRESSSSSSSASTSGKYVPPSVRGTTDSGRTPSGTSSFTTSSDRPRHWTPRRN